MTVEQKKAANPAHSVWVSANAGSGKTRVLTERVLRLLLQGVLPQRILCLTFTKAAAAEMTQRVQKKLLEWVTISEEALRQELAQLTEKNVESQTLMRARRLFAEVTDAPDGIRIQTIHSLCQSLLRRFAIEAGVSPYFRLMEDHESKVLLQAAKERLLTANSQTPDAQKLVGVIQHIAAEVSETSLDDVLEAIVAQRAKIEKVVAKGLEYFQQNITRSLEIDYLNQSEDKLIKKYFTYTAEEITQLKLVCEALYQGSEATDVKLAKGLDAWLQVHQLPSPQYVDEWLGKMFTQEKTPRVLKSLFTAAVRKKCAFADEVLGKELERASAFWQEQSAYRNAWMSENLWHVAAAFLAFYQYLKQERGLLDYEDLIAKAGELLAREGVAQWVLYKLDGGIDHLLVDEAQDTSRVQWKLIQALATEFFVGESAAKKNRTLFVVGDEKQSIYSFQGAEPRAFAEMKQFFAKQIKDAEKIFEPVSLSLSFRSADAILKVVDAVFELPEMSDGVVFSEDTVRHQAHRETAGRVEIWPIITPDEVEDREEWTIPDKQINPQSSQSILAEKIATTIAQWLREKRLLKAYNRPIKPSDIIILVRRRNAFFHALIPALKRHQIPFAGADRLKLGEHIAIQDLLALAQFLLLPEDDLSLCCLLKSPLFGFSEEQIFELCYGRKGSVWSALQQSQDPAAQKLENWLAKVDFLAPFEMFSFVVEAQGGRQKFVARMGDEVNDPLNEFLSLALNYERLHQPSMQGFLSWFEQLDIEIKRDMELARDEVRLLTIHGAKGLEAPIVFMPDTTTQRESNKGNSLVWSRDEKVFYWAAKKELTCSIVEQCKKVDAEDSAEENKRLLYVAMTRAADELYIAGWAGDKGKIPDDCWYQKIKTAMEPFAEKITTQTEHGELLETLVYADREQAEMLSTMTSQPIAANVLTDLPVWANRLAPAEPLPPKPLTPSRPTMAEPAADSPTLPQEIFQRGKAMHRLLEVLPEMPEVQWEQAGLVLLKQSLPVLAEEKYQALLHEVFEVLKDEEFAAVFGEGSQAEVPITALLTQDTEPRVLSGQIDRLLVQENQVLVLDYKTNQQIPASVAEIPDYYRHQLTSYVQALRLIYPQKVIRTAILWTAAPLLMLVDESHPTT